MKIKRKKQPPENAGRFTIEASSIGYRSNELIEDAQLLRTLFESAKWQIHQKLHKANVGDVEDIAQLSLEKLYRHFDFERMATLPDDEQKKLLFSFLNRVVSQCVIDHLRKVRRANANQNRPLEALIRINKDQLPEAKAALRTLSKRNRELLDLKIVQGLSDLLSVI